MRRPPSITPRRNLTLSSLIRRGAIPKPVKLGKGERIGCLASMMFLEMPGDQKIVYHELAEMFGLSVLTVRNHHRRWTTRWKALSPDEQARMIQAVLASPLPLPVASK
ncbi:MAG: hypothetical protein HOP32_16365 [Nitrospira sp.]|nr:hypothetical protein [Nitrospira sp.]